MRGGRRERHSCEDGASSGETPPPQRPPAAAIHLPNGPREPQNADPPPPASTARGPGRKRSYVNLTGPRPWEPTAFNSTTWRKTNCNGSNQPQTSLNYPGYYVAHIFLFLLKIQSIFTKKFSPTRRQIEKNTSGDGEWRNGPVTNAFTLPASGARSGR